MIEPVDAGATAVRVVVRGEVQGVGYRDATLGRARGLEVMGWVRNADDGSVLVHAEGPEPAVDDAGRVPARGATRRHGRRGRRSSA